MTTFADIKPRQVFYMDIGGMDNVRCEKLTDDTFGCRKLNGEWMEASGKPAWEVKTDAEFRAHKERQYSFNNQRRIAGSVPGHSNTYPYGEH